MPPQHPHEIEDAVLDIVSVETGVNLEELSLNDRFQQDLFTDALTLAQIVMAVEEVFDVGFEDRYFGNMKETALLQTVGDVSSYLCHALLGAPERIAADRMLPILRAACPTAPKTETELGEPATFTDMGDFAHHIVNSQAGGDVAEVQAFFGVLERLIAQGYFSVRLLAIIGLIEDIQNIASGEPGGYKAFEPHLGEVSRQAWGDVEVMWKGHASLADVSRAESAGQAAPPPRALFQTRSRPGA